MEYEGSDQAKFCSACGTPVAGDPEHASDGPSVTESETLAGQAVASQPNDASETPQAAEFVEAVREAMSDGVVDAQDRELLEEARRTLDLSEIEAASLEDAAISGQTAGKDSPEPRQNAPGVALAINDNHFHMENYVSVLDFKLTNQGDSPAMNVCLKVHGRRMGDIDSHDLSLQPAEDRQVMVQVEPSVAGEHLIDISLSYTLGGTAYTWNAQSLLKVLARNEDPSTVIFDQRIQGEAGAKIGFGLSLRNELHNGKTSGVLQTANDLLTQSYPSRWQNIGLLLQKAEPIGRVQIAPGFASRRGRLAKAAIVLGEGGADARILLLGQRRVSMARSAACGDLLLRLLPRNHDNDAQSVLISGSRPTGRPHLVISLDKTGLTLSDEESQNGTWLNGHRVNDRTSIPLDGPSELNVAEVLKLRLVPLLGERDASQDGAERYQDIASGDELWRLAAKCNLRGLAIERVDNLPGKETYLVIFRWANIGGGADCDVKLPGAGATRARIRIAWLDGQFWIENLSENSPLSVDGVDMACGLTCPLWPGAAIELGGQTIEFADFAQKTR